MQRPINVWNTHFRRLFLSVSNYIHIWIIFYNCYCGLKSLLFPTSTTMRSYNRICDSSSGMNKVQILPKNWPDHGYFTTKYTSFFLHHQAENPSIFQYRTVAPNKVQVDIGHQHSCTFFYFVRRVFLTCAESEGKTNEQSLRVACAGTGKKYTNT